ncbi:MAG: hypothetical protein NVSMB49_04680 [Ktedonobacteraceae bacterium]
MLRNLTEYHWAEYIDDALLLMGRLDVKTVPLAGGTYLLGLDDDSIEAVVDLRELGLSYIVEGTRGIRIGAMTTLQNIVDDPLLKNFASGLLKRTAHASSSSRLIRNSATIGGTLGSGTASQADLLTALSLLEVQVVLRSGSKTSVNLSGGTTEQPGLALSGVVYREKQERRISCEDVTRERRPGELIVEVMLPSVSAACGTAFARVGRTPTDTALVNVAALIEIEHDVYKRVRLAFGGLNMEPIRMRAVEHALEGQHIDDSKSILAAIQTGMTEFRPPTDVRVSGGYRRISGGKLAQRVIEEASYLARYQTIMAIQSGKSKESKA